MEINYITDETKKAREFFQEKISFMITPCELKQKIKDFINDINIVDVREYDRYIDGHIPFAIHVPFNDLENHMVMLEKDKLNIIYNCSAYCHKAYKTAYYLASKGYMVRVLEGGFKIWEEKNYEIVKTSA